MFIVIQRGPRMLILFLFIGEILCQNINVEEAAEVCYDVIERSFDRKEERISHMYLLTDNMMHQRRDSVCLEKSLNIMRNVKNSTLRATWSQIMSQNINVEEESKANKSNAERSESKPKISHMDLLIDSMMHQRWEPDDSVCLEKILNIMYNVKNSTLWATWIWDAMQSPVGLLYGSKNQFGNYDQCMNAPWLHTHPEYRTQYCLADIKLADEELEHTYIHPDSRVKNYISSISTYGVTFNKLSLGVCLPVECKTRAVSQFVKVLFENSHLGNAVPDVNITVNPCQVAGAPVEYSKEFYLVIALLIMFASVTVLCTFFSNGEKNNSEGYKLINAFCLIRNTRKLRTSSDHDIKVMYGIRYLSSVLIVSWHVLVISMYLGLGNALKGDQDMHKYYLKVYSRVELAVDTFLMMSGLLLMKGLMVSKTVNPFIAIAKRYMRLACMMSIVVIILTYASIDIRSGPVWPIYLKIDITACEVNWWPTFLMLGNYIDTSNICYPVLWTMPVDFHLSIIGIMLYCIFTKNRRAGILIFGFVFVTSLFMPGYITYQRKLPGAPIIDLMSALNYRQSIFLNPTYIWSHLRGGPYFIGMIAGYILSIYKPVSHRRIIPKLISSIGVIIALFTIAMILAVGAHYSDRSKPYNVWEAAIFASVNRTIWAAAVASIILLCEYGSVPIVGSFLSWQTWVPLSKLSYGVYLLNCLIFGCMVYATRVTLTHDIFSIFINVLGITMMCNIVAFILHIFWEAPILEIFNILINYMTGKPKILHKNGISKKK